MPDPVIKTDRLITNDLDELAGCLGATSATKSAVASIMES